MPRLHPDQTVHQEWTEIVSDYEASGELVTFRLYVGNTDMSRYLNSGTLSADTGALPWMLDCDLATRLPTSMLNAPVTLYCEMGGAMLPLFRGTASYPMPSSEWNTQLQSLTAGHWMGQTTLDQYIEINGWTPQAAIRNALTRVPYDRSLVTVQPIETPLIYRLRQNVAPVSQRGSWAAGFEHTDSPLGMLDSYLAETNSVSIDHPLNGNTTIKDPGIGANLDLAWDYEADSNQVLEPFVSPAWASPDEQWTRVRVVDYLESGSTRIPPQDWYVDYAGMDYPPLVGRTYYIEVSDTSAGALENARKLAVETVRLLGQGLWTGGLSAAFNPFLVPYDAITIGHNYEDMTGRYRRHWRCIITGISHTFGTESLGTDISFDAALLLNRRMPDPPIVLRGVTAGNVRVPRPSMGFDVDAGYWFSAKEATQGWLVQDPDEGIVINLQAPDAYRYMDYDANDGYYIKV